MRLLIIATMMVLAGCAPSLRSVDADGLRYVQEDLAMREIASPPGADRIQFKTDYCVLDAILRAANKGPADNVAQPVKCKR